MILTNHDIQEFEIDLTGICNLQCPICTRNYTHASHLLKKNIRPLSEIIWQLDQFPNLNRIMLAGAISEPTGYPEFLDLIGYLNSRNIFIDLFTNGSNIPNSEYKKNKNFWEDLGKLFSEGNPNNICTFTICGSTNALHSKYRKGSSLGEILNNIKYFKKYSFNNDCVQFIEFEYNTNDINSKNLDYIKNMVTEWYTVQSEGRRRLLDFKKNDFKKEGIWPKEEIEKKYKKVFDRFFKIKVNPKKLNCKAIRYKKLHIDQFGTIFPCYMLMEFPESKDNYFYNLEEFKKAVEKNKVIFNFKKIHSCGFDECKFCDQSVEKLIQYQGLDFIC